ncbi:hypothetical protein SAMN05444416_10175 [Thermoactinomyces sp. DSM 45892]|nr:hypothetical protein SAMN05444416_10175 [Thermoactinomyces sp. DSM 45892]
MNLLEKLLSYFSSGDFIIQKTSKPVSHSKDLVEEIVRQTMR